MDTRITSPRITELKPGEIFVFGSNLEGAHGAYWLGKSGELYGDKEQACKDRLTASQPCTEAPTPSNPMWTTSSASPASIPN